jgi:hypothetical protein
LRLWRRDCSRVMRPPGGEQLLPLVYLRGRLARRVDLRAFPTCVLAIALAFVVGTLGGTAACSGRPAPSTPVAGTPAPHRTSGRPLHVLFVGASITSGWYASAGHDYRSLLERDLAQRGYSLQVQTWARPGARVANLAHFQAPTAKELIVLQLGTNDSGSRRPTDPGVFATEYSGLVPTAARSFAGREPGLPRRLGKRVHGQPARGTGCGL